MKVDDATVGPRLEQFKAAAKAAQIKLTHQRLEIFREIASSLDHPDAEAVYRAVQLRVPTVSRDTVYRTLWKLQELGLITTLGLRRQSVRFDANLERHHHYICIRCGLARDFKSTGFNALRVPAAVKELGSIMDTQVEVRGVCASCQKKGSRNAVSAKPAPSEGPKGRKA